MLDKIAGRANLAAANKSDSRKHLGIQAVDMLTGAIKAAHHLFLDQNCPLSPGKKLLLDRLAKTLGWDALHYDTWPNRRAYRQRTVELLVSRARKYFGIYYLTG